MTSPVSSVSSANQEIVSHSKEKKSKINFGYFLNPFVELIQSTGYCFFNTTVSIIDSCEEFVSAFGVVFYRLTHSSSFDPYHPSFKKLLNEFKEQAPILEGKIEALDQRFWKNYLINRDVKRLKKLHQNVQQSLNKLNSYCDVLEKYNRHFPIQEELESVRADYQYLSDQLDVYCLQKGKEITGLFSQAVDVFTKQSVELPKDIGEELIQTFKMLKEVFSRRIQKQNSNSSVYKAIHSEMVEINHQIQILKKQKSQEKASRNIKGHPLKLRNIGNSCYLDSVLQSFLCMDSILEQFNEPISRDPKHPKDYQKKLTIQQELLQFINSSVKKEDENSSLTQMELILFLLGGGPSLHRLRDAIFKSGFHHELADMRTLRDQHDAYAVAELFINEFLPNCKFKWQGHAKTDVLPGLDFKQRVEELSTLQVPLLSQTKWQSLDRLLKAFLGEHIQRERDPKYQRKFDPKEGKILKGKDKEAASVLNANAIKVDEFYESYKLVEAPPVMVIQFKRFINQRSASGAISLSKRNYPVILPQNGLLDLSDYYEAPKGAPKEALYRIKSMVRHLGSSLKNGHYVADVEIDGNYYRCDDCDPKFYKKISRAAFFNNKDPYLLFLERVDAQQLHALP